MRLLSSPAWGGDLVFCHCLLLTHSVPTRTWMSKPVKYNGILCCPAETSTSNPDKVIHPSHIPSPDHHDIITRSYGELKFIPTTHLTFSYKEPSIYNCRWVWSFKSKIRRALNWPELASEWCQLIHYQLHLDTFHLLEWIASNASPDRHLCYTSIITK